jgi:hypothetical protein
MGNEKPFHDWVVKHLKQRLSRDYQDIRINLEGEKKEEFKGHYPDLILSNHGMVLAVMEVETDKSITLERIKNKGHRPPLENGGCRQGFNRQLRYKHQDAVIN